LHFDRATRVALEYPQLLALVAGEARTDLGAARLFALEPAADRSELDRRRAAWEEVARLSVEGPFAPSLGEPLEPLLSRIESDLDPLDGSEILLVARLLAAGGEAARRIAAADPACPELASRLDGLDDPEPLLRRIEQVLDDKGRVRDDASPRLIELARQARSSRDRLYRELERVRSDHADLFVEETTPMRGGRLLLVLDSGARGRLPGLVHGRSGSGRSFYFEPLAAVEENNTLQSAVEEQEEERARLLRELLDALVENAGLVGRLADLVGELDALESSVRFARRSGGRLVPISETRKLVLREARHPLLDPRLAPLRESRLGAAGHAGEAVPLDLELGGERRVLVVTGPNAGGKTVALKCAGLAALAHQAGLPVACGPGSELPLFDHVVATVGDEQDLLADRSTFSGRLERLAEAWSGAGPASLALLDELGSGTDPEEGSALGVALVEHLLERGGLGIVTTHLSAVALAALDHDGASCAAMEFDPASGRPTFRLRPGAPGGSEAIALARRLGLPERWIERAEGLLGDEQRELRRVLVELERTRGELAAASAEAAARAAEAAEEAARLDRERARLESERRMVGKRLEGELERFREGVRSELRATVERLKKEIEAGRRRGLEAEATRRLFESAPELAVDEEPADSGGPLVEGAAVRHRALGWKGRLERLDGGRAEVVVGGKRLRCKAGELLVVAGPEAAPSRSGRVSAPEAPGVEPELHLLGFTVEEGLAAVEAYLDRALSAGREEVRIVHGHGTGRLRDAVRAHLRKHPAVDEARPGAPNEGGNGATVVRLAG